MQSILILCAGVAIVIGGVLILRLHAFLALTLGALVVGALTPSTSVEKFLLEKEGWKVIRTATADGQPQVDFATGVKTLANGSPMVVFRTSDGEATRIGRAAVFSPMENASGEEAKHTVSALLGAASSEPQVGDLICRESTAVAATKLAKMTVGERVAKAFGTTCGKIGILIAMAAIIGKCLLDSGAADRIVRSALGVVGERGAPLAFAGSGFVLGVPVFFDTVFYLMMPLGKALRMRTGRNYLLYILTIVAGATMAHSLVPPTPGPLMVAEELNVDLGLMILFGVLVGFCSSSAALVYAYWRNANNEVPLRESPDMSLEELEALSKQDTASLPSLSLSLLPILLPVFMISGYTVLKSIGVKNDSLMAFAATIGNKNIALAVAAAIAMAMLAWQRKLGFVQLAETTGAALASGGVIILITAAGGAFGGVMQQTGVAGLIRDMPAVSTWLVLVLAFLITTAIRTAQGSATVAMITAVGVLSGFASEGALLCHPVYLALAIGCGSKPIAWMNDSGFWVICKMSGMTEQEGLKYITPMSILMGIVGLIVTILLATVLPMQPS